MSILSGPAISVTVPVDVTAVTEPMDSTVELCITEPGDVVQFSAPITQSNVDQSATLLHIPPVNVILSGSDSDLVDSKDTRQPPTTVNGNDLELVGAISNLRVVEILLVHFLEAALNSTFASALAVPAGVKFTVGGDCE